MAGIPNPGLQFFPLSRGNVVHLGAIAFGVARLDTDAIGTTTVMFDGVDVGTEIHVYLPDGENGTAGTELTGTESCIEHQQLTWPVYASGSPNNSVIITLVKRGLRWQKFTYESKSGNQTIPIFPQPDLGYRNPT